MTADEWIEANHKFSDRLDKILMRQAWDAAFVQGQLAVTNADLARPEEAKCQQLPRCAVDSDHLHQAVEFLKLCLQCDLHYGKTEGVGWWTDNRSVHDEVSAFVKRIEERVPQEQEGK